MPTRRGLMMGGFMAMLAGLFRPKQTLAQPSSAPGMIDLDDPRYERFAAARRQVWSPVGPVDDDVIAYIISPELQGLPAWPTTRQSYLVIRPPGSLIIASDGLSDLFVDTDSQEAGFGCEVYLESPDLAGADFAAVRSSWQFSLIENFAQNVADFGGLTGPLEKYGIVSMELPAPANMPARWVTDRQSVGALIDIQVPGRPARCQLGEGTDIRLIALTLLLPDEVSHVVDTGDAARTDLAQRLISSGTGLTSPGNRRSVLA
jgi:hypothetical protein